MMPETIRSGSKSISPSTAKRTQSTGVPSVAKPLEPSSKVNSSTHNGVRVVMLRALADRFESGATTASSTPGHSGERTAQVVQPGRVNAVVVCDQDLHLWAAQPPGRAPAQHTMVVSRSPGPGMPGHAGQRFAGLKLTRAESYDCLVTAPSV